MRRPIVGPILFVAVCLAGCDRGAPRPAPEPPPREVEIVQVLPRDLRVDFSFVGRTESSQRVEIRARVAAYLDEISFEEGGFVEEGELLFRLDPAPFESRLRGAQAALAQQQARLDNARALLARIEPLAAAEAVAAKELDDARGRVNEAAAAVEGASAGVFDAELNLEYTEIRSPVGGLTGAATQREGAYISLATPALTYVARIDPMWVEFSVTETQVLRAARQGTDGSVAYPPRGEFLVSVELSDGRVHPETGRISFTDATVSAQTGAVQVRAEIPNSARTLRPGQFVRVTLRGAYRPGAITVPRRAVAEGPPGPYVWVVGREGRAEQRPVFLGPWAGESWVIESGLSDGDRVVVNGRMGLRVGTALAVVRILPLDGDANDALGVGTRGPTP